MSVQSTTVKMICDMDLTLYPFDSQLCPIVIESYGHPKSEIDIKWCGIHPIKYRTTHLPTFNMDSGYTVLNCSREYGHGVIFPCAEGYFLMSRNARYYLIHAYMYVNAKSFIQHVSKVVV